MTLIANKHVLQG